MTLTKEELEKYLIEIGVIPQPGHGGWKTFMEITHFLDSFSGEKKRTYCQWIQEYFEKPITPEEQGKIDTGEWRVDDV